MEVLQKGTAPGLTLGIKVLQRERGGILVFWLFLLLAKARHGQGEQHEYGYWGFQEAINVKFSNESGKCS